jgi:hypothetical protein
VRMNWISLGIAAGLVMSLAACKSSTPAGPGGGGAGGFGGGGGAGGGGGGNPGGTTCSELYNGGAWDKTLAESDFADSASFQAYDALNQCACVATNGMTPAGCENICTMGDNGTTTPNFCDGSAAGPSCTTCITTTSCGTELTDCMSN